MIYAPPGAPGAKIQYKPRYDNFIGGKFVAPVKGQYFDVVTPISGKVYTQAARSSEVDIERALGSEPVVPLPGGVAPEPLPQASPMSPVAPGGA
jgi:aldehyde dehydrogenase